MDAIDLTDFDYGDFDAAEQLRGVLKQREHQYLAQRINELVSVKLAEGAPAGDTSAADLRAQASATITALDNVIGTVREQLKLLSAPVGKADKEV